MGSPLSRLVGREEIEPLLEQRRCSGSRKNAYEKERLGKAIDRIGFDRFEAALFSDDLLARKAEILGPAYQDALSAVLHRSRQQGRACAAPPAPPLDKKA